MGINKKENISLSDIFYRLKNFKKKHNLYTEIDKRYDGTIEFTIFDKNNNNNFIYFYDFDTYETRIKKLNRCLKCLNSKRKALNFIKEEY